MILYKDSGIQPPPPAPNPQDVLATKGGRYRFQGQERMDEVKGAGNSWDYKYRMHDPRLGRFFAVDPLSAKYPWNSNYAFSENRVIDGIELEGAGYKPVNSWSGQVDNKMITKKLGSSYDGQNMTFSEYYNVRSTQIAEYYEGHELDCADLHLKVLNHFAVENKLPLEVKSYRADLQESSGSNDGVIRPNYSRDEGFSQQAVDEVYSKLSKVGASDFFKNDWLFKDISSAYDLKGGDIITAKYGDNHFHVQLLMYSIHGKAFGHVEVMQGNTDDTHSATPISKEQYRFDKLNIGEYWNNENSGNNVNQANYQRRQSQPLEIKLRRYNFEQMQKSYNSYLKH